MAKYRMVLVVDGSRLDTVEKRAKAAFGEDFLVVHKVDPSRSRADRLSDIESDIQSSSTSVEELKDELQDWYDNLPENLQNTGKGEELQDAIDALETLKDELDQIDFSNVSFPGMY